MADERKIEAQPDRYQKENANIGHLSTRNQPSQPEYYMPSQPIMPQSPPPSPPPAAPPASSQDGT